MISIALKGGSFGGQAIGVPGPMGHEDGRAAVEKRLLRRAESLDVGVLHAQEEDLKVLQLP